MTASQYTDEQINHVRRLAGLGNTDAQISSATDIPRRRVRALRERYGIPAGQPVTRVLDSDDRVVRPLPPSELDYLRRAVGWRPDVDYDQADAAVTG